MPRSNNILIAANSVIVGLLPWIYMFKFPFGNINFGTVLLVVALFLGLVNTLQKGTWRKPIPIGTLLIFYLFCFFRTFSFSTSSLSIIVIIGVLFCVTQGSVSKNILSRTMSVVVVVNSLLIVFQTICFYAFGKAVDLVSPSAVINEAYATYIGGLYRPHGLFLEPAHFAQFATLLLVILLFEKRKRKLLIAITVVGVILSTSGIGIVLTICVFIYFAIFSVEKPSSSIKRLVVMTLIIAFALFVLFQLSFFRSAVARFLSPDDNYNAISGRSGNMSTIFDMLSGNRALLFGLGDNYYFVPWLNGIASVFIRYGLTGVILLITSFAMFFLRVKNALSRCVSVIFLGLLFVSNCTSVYHMVFFVCLIYIGNTEHCFDLYQKNMAYVMMVRPTAVEHERSL